MDTDAQFLVAWKRFDFGESKLTTRPDQWKLATVVLKLRAVGKTKPPPEVVELLHAVRPREQVRSDARPTTEKRPTAPQSRVNYTFFLDDQ
jgi:hypothetical protein